MPSTEHGHAGEGGAAVLSLSTPMIETLDEGRLGSLVETLVSLARSGETEEALADRLDERLNELGIAHPRPVVDRMVENLRNARDLTVVTDTGRVLHGDPGWSATTQDPSVESTEDPEHPDRPAYS